MRTVICRTLRHEYRLHAPDAFAEELRFVEADPELPDFDLAPLDIEVREANGFLSARLPSGELVEGTANHLVNVMHRVVFEDIVGGEDEAPLIHGATVSIDGRRLLIVGHKGCGKSTLALHLVMQGHRVEGDEHLLLRAQDVVARPRTLRVKQGSMAVVAGLPERVVVAPSISNWDGSVIRAVSPAIGGVPWVIRPGRLDGLIFLVANHGGRSSARRIDGQAALQRMMKEIILPQRGIAAAAARAQRVAMTVPAYQLTIGDLGTATWHLELIAKLLTS